jgi:hypothetical protein
MKTRQRKTTETKSSFFHVVNLDDVTPLTSTFSGGGPSYRTKIFRHISKLQRLKKKGLTPQGGKAEMRALCDEGRQATPDTQMSAREPSDITQHAAAMIGASSAPETRPAASHRPQTRPTKMFVRRMNFVVINRESR